MMTVMMMIVQLKPNAACQGILRQFIANGRFTCLKGLTNLLLNANC